MTEHIRDGWELALAILGTVLGMIPVIAVLALILFGTPWAIDQTRHRYRAWRLRREFVKAGRGTQAREVDRLAAQGWDAGQIAARIAGRNGR